jgi:hypothetical protein
LKDQTQVKNTPHICFVKHYLNVIYVLTTAALLYTAQSAAAESRRIARIEGAKIVARDAEEVARYKLQLWFQQHARHSFYEFDGKISLCARRDGATAAARMRKPDPSLSKAAAIKLSRKAELMRGGSR